jgi:hypothetical protein
MRKLPRCLMLLSILGSTSSMLPKCKSNMPPPFVFDSFEFLFIPNALRFSLLLDSFICQLNVYRFLS